MENMVANAAVGSRFPTVETISEYLSAYGTEVTVRGKQTKEVLSYSTDYPLGYFPTRKGMSTRLIIAESLLILAGTFDIDLIMAATPKGNRVLFTEQMAYGPRLAMPLLNVIRALEIDRYSRRAIAHISNPDDACSSQTPCTTAMQFFIRENRMFVDVCMRSWDLVFGLPVDLGVFGTIGLVMADCFQVLPGLLSVHAGSLHRYAETAHLIAPHPKGDFGEVKLLHDVNPGSPSARFLEYQEVAYDAIHECRDNLNWNTFMKIEVK